MQHLWIGRIRPRRFLLGACLGLVALLAGPRAVATTVLTGTGTNQCTLFLNFSSGEKLAFTHRFNAASIIARTVLETIIAETGGSLLSTGYLTDFPTALSLLPGTPAGLVVHYQSSTDYPDPYINGILWAPTGANNGDYLGEFDWWQIWVQGPAELAQPYNDPPDPLVLATGSGWVSPPASGLKDIALENGASFGLVYGSANAPAAPPPGIRSSRILPGNQLEITFETVPNISYILKSKPQLTGGVWTPVQSLVAASHTVVLVVPMNHPSGREFFRLEVAP